MTNKELQDKLKQYPDSDDIGLVLLDPTNPSYFIAGKLEDCRHSGGTMLFLQGRGMVGGDDAPPLS